jgi:transcriptional regulator with XRE-family HTH domain
MTGGGDDASAASRIGHRIRAIRHERSLTLVQVAERSGLSQPFLSQVETGSARPSFASVDRIARALGTTQIELFAALADSPTSGTPDSEADDQRTLGHSGPFAEGSVRVLAPSAHSFSPVEFTAQNGEFGEYFVHNEEEFVYVIEGVVEVDLAGSWSRRVAGESFFLPPQIQHRWRSTNGGRYRVLSIKQKLDIVTAPDTATPRHSDGSPVS